MTDAQAFVNTTQKATDSFLSGCQHDRNKLVSDKAHTFSAHLQQNCLQQDRSNGGYA